MLLDTRSLARIIDVRCFRAIWSSVMAASTAMMHEEPETKSKMRWVPLESSPEVFQEVRPTAVQAIVTKGLSLQWTSTLGLKATDATFVDVYGLEPELL